MMKDIKIIALHLAYGGVEKAICNMANMFIEQYPVEIICVYKMPFSPAYQLDERVKIRYLSNVIPNKNDFFDAVHSKNLIRLIKEGIKSLRILHIKKKVIINLARELHDCIIITTRNEDTVVFNKYGHSDTYRIAQLHHDHCYDKKLVHDFRHHYNNFDLFVLLCEQLCEETKSIMKGYNQHTKCVVVPNFIENLPVEDYNKEELIVAVGRLHKVKGFMRMLQMFRQIHAIMPNWKLHIIGDGDEYEVLKAEIYEHDMEGYVQLLGRMDEREISEEMKKASLYLMTSFSEGFPFVLLEAMSHHLPIVAFDVRVGPRSIVDESCGILVPDGNETLFQSACVSLMQDEKRREIMGKKAYEKASYYTRNNVSSMWFSLLEKGN